MCNAPQAVSFLFTTALLSKLPTMAPKANASPPQTPKKGGVSGDILAKASDSSRSWISF